MLDGFYHIYHKTLSEDTLTVRIYINPEHRIFDGHFPEQPVVPGVVQLQIVKEILENHLEKKLMLNKVTQVKYLVPVIPDKKVEIIVKIGFKKVDENTLKVDATISNDEALFTKSKLGFTEI